MAFKFDLPEKAAEALRKGEMIIIVDDKARENEGDLVIAAEKATEEKLNFMNKAGGLMCIPITQEKAIQLDLPRMAKNTDRFETPFTVSVDAKKGGTGISIKDRLLTVKTILSKESKPEDLVRPGHIFPLVAKEGGVKQRLGHTEAAIELLKIAGMQPVAVICEIMNKDGSMARLNDLEEFAKKHSLAITSVKEIAKATENKSFDKKFTLKKIAKAKLPTKFGEFEAVGFKDLANNNEYIAIVKGTLEGNKDVLVRLHSACLTGDVFHSMRCDCNEQLHMALEIINKEGTGVILYIPHHEGRGIGILNKLKAYELQEKGRDTVQANVELGFESDNREFETSGQILKELGLTTIRLLTNNPKKLKSLRESGLEITGNVPLRSKANKHNEKYLKTKKEKMGHYL